MQSLEQFKAEQLAAMQKAEAAHVELLARAQLFTDAGLPIPDYIAKGNLFGAVSCAYRNKGAGHKPEELRSMAQALALFRLFADSGKVIAFHILKAGCTIMHPEQHMTERLKREGYKRDAYKSTGYAVQVSVTHIHESQHTSAELEFFAAFGGKLWRVSIEFGQGHIGRAPGLAPHMAERRGYGNKLESRSFEPNRDAYGLADGYLSYSYGGDMGPVKTGADHRFCLSQTMTKTARQNARMRWHNSKTSRLSPMGCKND